MIDIISLMNMNTDSAPPPEELNKLAEEFYNVLTVNRDQLGNFLKKDIRYTTYKTLSQIFIEIQNKRNYVNGNLVTDLLLGLIGPECNKQKAIYELPTFELMATIFSIAVYLDVKAIEEIMAGQGLFGSLFEHYYVKNNGHDISFNSTDGICQCETSGNNPYYPIEKKYLIEYLIEKETGDKQIGKDKIFLALWPNLEISITQFKEFINRIIPEFFILVGQKDMYKDYFKVFKKAKYDELTFTPYQICFKDTITKDGRGSDTNLPDISHSTVTLFTNENIKDNKKEINDSICALANSFNIKGSEPYSFRNKGIDETDKYVLKFFSEHQLIPSPVVKDIPDIEIKNIIKYLFDLSKHRKPVSIPDYLISLEEFKFWYQLYKTNRFPKLLKTHERFNEFKTFYEEIDRNNFIPANVIALKNKNILPQWVSNKQDGIKCLILDYSTSDRYKLWKQSRDLMNDFYNNLFRPNRNSSN